MTAGVHRAAREIQGAELNATDAPQESRLRAIDQGVAPLCRQRPRLGIHAGRNEGVQPECGKASDTRKGDLWQREGGIRFYLAIPAASINIPLFSSPETLQHARECALLHGVQWFGESTPFGNEGPARGRLSQLDRTATRAEGRTIFSRLDAGIWYNGDGAVGERAESGTAKGGFLLCISIRLGRTKFITMWTRGWRRISN